MARALRLHRWRQATMAEADPPRAGGTPIRGRDARPRRTLLACMAAASLLPGVRPPLLGARAFEAKTADFAIAFNREVSRYRDAAAFVLPGDPLAVQALA